MWFPTRSDTNQSVQSQKMAEKLEILHLERLEELYYQCSENKGDDASLFSHLCKILVFS